MMKEEQKKNEMRREAQKREATPKDLCKETSNHFAKYRER